MKKNVCIVTLYDDNNYGNRLQNYAVQEKIKELNCNCESIINVQKYDNVKYKIKNFIKYFVKKRFYNFTKFNNNITFSKIRIDNSKELSQKNIDRLNQKYDMFITGSDQVWNPTLKRFNKLELLYFTSPEKRVSFSASFGISELPNEYVGLFSKEIAKFKNVSVREDAGKRIIDKLKIKKDVEVLIDPTMLLTANDWDKVAKQPKQYNGEKYILNYFLGNLSESRKMQIEKIAKERDCRIINILDENDPFYVSGPSEFLWLEKNAELICTDSFHSSVFAIIYNKPFIVFNREDKSTSMNSRIETLLSKFNLKNREYNEKYISEENLNHDYTEAYEILKMEREKSFNFLKKALDVEGE